MAPPPPAEVAVELPAFEATALDAIPGICAAARAAFASRRTRDVEWRLVQLRRLYWAIEDFTPQLLEAVRRDLHKSAYEATFSEVDWCKEDCLFLARHLRAFARDAPLGAPDVPLQFRAVRPRVRKEPLGTALILGPYNFPIMLLLQPLAGAIAAGCCAVVKPSELCPSVAAVLADMVRGRLDGDAFAVVNGGVPETEALMAERRWDKIFFTGSPRVGALVAARAAETLTPVCLELGGRNPAFVTRNADLPLAARRILWGKVLNAGQVCLAQNYVLVQRDAVDAFVGALAAAYRDMMPQGARESPEYVCIVNARHFGRIKKMLDETGGRIVMGGQADEADLFIEPTAVLVDSVDDSMMREEAFGPVFSIMPFDTLDDAIRIYEAVDPTPLSLATFGSRAENEKVLNSTTSGGASVNDAYMQGSIVSVPFGGVGTSGHGSYRGRQSFECFSHARVVADTPSWLERFLRMRYPPYDWRELRRMRLLLGGAPRPGFDRTGAVVRRGLVASVAYWTGLVLRLGARGPAGALLRWLALLLASCLLAVRTGSLSV